DRAASRIASMTSSSIKEPPTLVLKLRALITLRTPIRSYINLPADIQSLTLRPTESSAGIQDRHFKNLLVGHTGVLEKRQELLLQIGIALSPIASQMALHTDIEGKH